MICSKGLTLEIIKWHNQDLVKDVAEVTRESERRVLSRQISLWSVLAVFLTLKVVMARAFFADGAITHKLH